MSVVMQSALCSTSWLCSAPPPAWHWSCEGHDGDSEALFLQIYYDEEHQHWNLDDAWCSQHGTLYEYPCGPSYIYPLPFSYPDRPGGYRWGAAHFTGHVSR